MFITLDKRDRSNPENHFFDVLITRTENDKLETTVFWKANNTNQHTNWKSHALM